MIAYENLPKIREIANRCSRVLDIGGGRHVLPYATHVIDLEGMTSENISNPIDDTPPRFSEKTWIQHDVCEGNFPFENKYFDFSFCSHLLEDIRDPIAVCKEIIRVSKAGYIEVPSRKREIFVKSRFSGIRNLFGDFPVPGFPHHRWFVEIENDKIIFTAKNGHFFKNKNYFINRSKIGRKLSSSESAIFLFWENSFEFTERIFINSGEMEKDLQNFRNKSLEELKNKSPVRKFHYTKNPNDSNN